MLISMLIYIFGPSMIAYIHTALLANVLIAMAADDCGGAPLPIIFELSIMHLITTNKQFVSYRCMYTNFNLRLRAPCCS